MTGMTLGMGVCVCKKSKEIIGSFRASARLQCHPHPLSAPITPVYGEIPISDEVLELGRH